MKRLHMQSRFVLCEILFLLVPSFISISSESSVLDLHIHYQIYTLLFSNYMMDAVTPAQLKLSQMQCLTLVGIIVFDDLNCTLTYDDI